MKTRLILLALAPLWMLPSHSGFAQEPLKYGSAVKLSPVFYLPVLAAEARGFFKENGVAAEWFPARSGADLQREFAASAIPIASSTGTADVLAIARGVPTVIVANLQSNDDFAIWIGADSRIRAPQDLKGAKLGVSQLGGAEHAYGRLTADRLGLANEVRFVSTGGIQESLALLATGGIDGVVLTPSQMINLKLKGKVRNLLPVELPKPWEAFTVTARRDFVAKQPDQVRRVVRALIAANRFIMSPDGKPWALATMKSESKYSDVAAEAIYKTLDLSQDGRIDPAAIRNVTQFLVKYDLLKPDQAPS
ncbi:MAG: ABC transporter substrate-binding protein, partial [Stellaceae bacterium]